MVKQCKAKHIKALAIQMDKVAEFVVKALDGQVGVAELVCTLWLIFVS
jgi:hypothetical protein